MGAFASDATRCQKVHKSHGGGMGPLASDATRCPKVHTSHGGGIGALASDAANCPNGHTIHGGGVGAVECLCDDTEHIGRNLRSGISRIHSLLELWLVSPPATIRQDGITSALIVGFIT